MHAGELPEVEPGRTRRPPAAPGSQPNEVVAAAAHRAGHSGCDNAGVAIRARARSAVMNDSLKTLLIIAFLVVILYNLGAGLYYMMVDKGETNRTVKALTWRIALSVALILLVALAICMGWIKPHGIGRAP